MAIDWTAKLRHLLQVLAFALAIATIQYGFQPERPYAPTVVYSLCISFITWAIIDFGRNVMASARETGWPRGWHGLALVGAGIIGGYLLGTWIADRMCLNFNWYAGYPPVDRASELRSSILITALAGIVVTFYFYARNKSAYLQRKMSEAHRHANEARLKLLETQLEPHMLFNTLANLRALIDADPQRAQQMLDHMIAYLRATLSASRAATHTLQAEFDRLRDYLELMSIRMGPRLTFELKLPPELAQHPVPALLLQPLVENSIQHGLEPKVEGGRVAVSARRDGADLVLEVTDTGVGPNGATDALKATSSNGTGFGIAHVRERLAAQYGAAARVEFAAQAGGGARVTLRFPFQS
jgi:signal transduction histidine kinase